MAKYRITSIPKSKKFQDGGEENTPLADGIDQRVQYAEGQTPEGFAQSMPIYSEVGVKAKAPLWVKLAREYEKKNSKQAFIDEKKRKYLKNTNRGLAKAAGLSMDNFPEQVERNFANEYEYKKNSYVGKKLSKEKGFNIRRRGEWVDELTEGEKKVIANSKYESKLQPNYFDRTKAGLQKLYYDLRGVNAPDLNVSGLTKKEREAIAKNRFGALESLAFLETPGAKIANAIEQSGNLSYGSGYRQGTTDDGERLARVNDLQVMALNPLNYTLPYDIPMLGQSLVRGAANLRNVKNVANASREFAEIQPLQKFIGNTGAVAEDVARAAEIPSIRNVARTLPEARTAEQAGVSSRQIMTDDALSQMYKEKAMRELQGDTMYRDNIEPYADENQSLFDENNFDESWYDESDYNIYDYDPFDNDNPFDNDDPFDNQLPPPPSEIRIPETSGNLSAETRADLIGKKEWLTDELEGLNINGYDEVSGPIAERANLIQEEIAAINLRLREARQQRTQQIAANTPSSAPATIEDPTLPEVSWLSDNDINTARDVVIKMFGEGNDTDYLLNSLATQPEGSYLRNEFEQFMTNAGADPAPFFRPAQPQQTVRHSINDPIDNLTENPFLGLRGDREVSITPISRDTARRLINTTDPTTGASLQDLLELQDNPLNVMNEIRRLVQEGTISENTASELITSLRDEIRNMPVSSAEKKFFVKEAKRISKVDKELPYTGSNFTTNDIYDKFDNLGLSEAEAENIIESNYGYTAKDVERVLAQYANDPYIQQVINNQLYDDIIYYTEHGKLNPNRPAVNFKTGEISKKLEKQTELTSTGLDLDEIELIENSRYKEPLTATGSIRYDYVEEPRIHTLKDKSIIPKTKDLDKQIDIYEKAIKKLSDGELKTSLTTKLEDLKSTKWIRTEYAKELKAKGLNPNQIEEASIISNSPDGGQKQLIDKDGNVIGTLNAYNSSTNQGVKGFKISSTGVNLKFHPYNIKHSKFKDWDEAEEFIMNEGLQRRLGTLTNEADKTNPIVLKSFKRQAKKEAEEIINQLKENNDNRYGEALYRGVHHGVKDTRGPVFTQQSFAETDLPDPVTGEIISRFRAKDYWGSQAKQLNEAGIPKAEFEELRPDQLQQSPGYRPNQSVIVRWKRGGQLDKLNKFIH
jgi:hypothetical protein